MAESILNSTKKLLGIHESDTSFDTDIVIFINSSLSELNQLGVGPVEGFSISDGTPTWAEFIGADPNLSPAKTYVYLSVKMVFDPPQTSFAIDAIKDQIEKIGWRLNVYTEGVKYPWVDGQL